MASRKASFARRWPASFAHQRVDAASAAGLLRLLSSNTIVEIGAGVPRALWFEIMDAVLADGAWIALPAEGLEALGHALGVAGPSGVRLVLVPGKTRSAAARRVFDVAVSLVLLIALIPLFLFIALGVRLSSPGPILYRGRVVGQDGESFEWYKFRTMRVAQPRDGEARREAFAVFARGDLPGGSDRKVVDTGRVTRFGALIRRHSLDELPQLWNVLRGDMALVGPRPCLAYEADLYEPWQRRRFQSRPGLTGLWQVFGRSRVGFEEAAIMDILYGYVGSVVLDLSLVGRTVPVVVRGRGGR